MAVDARRPGPHRAGADTLVIACGVVAALHVGKLPPALPVLRDALGVTLVEVHSATPEDWAEFVARQPGVKSAVHDRPLRVPTTPKRR